MIDQDEFLKDPKRFGDVVILSAEEYKDMQIRENAKMRESDKVYSHEEVFDELNRRIHELKAQRE